MSSSSIDNFSSWAGGVGLFTQPVAICLMFILKNAEANVSEVIGWWHITEYLECHTTEFDVYFFGR